MSDEVKNVTCAVRLDKPLYDRLVDVAAKSHKTLSEMIRAGIMHELEERSKEVLQKEIKQLRASLKETWDEWVEVTQDAAKQYHFAH
mgnify:CR=1 FL=1